MSEIQVTKVASLAKHIPIRIIERVDHTEDLWSVKVECDVPFTFKPGQYVTLGMPADPKPLERPYSIVSSPQEKQLELLMELVPQGLLSPHLYKLHPGDELLMRPRPKGLFFLDLAAGRSHHLLLATVTGIAPFVSMIRALADGTIGPITPDLRLICLHAASYAAELAYGRELAEIAQQYKWLTYVPSVSRLWDEANWQGESGRVEDILRKYADQNGLTPENSIAYLCGNPSMIANGEAILKRAGFDHKFMRQEEYFQLGK